MFFSSFPAKIISLIYKQDPSELSSPILQRYASNAQRCSDDNPTTSKSRFKVASMFNNKFNSKYAFDVVMEMM